MPITRVNVAALLTMTSRFNAIEPYLTLCILETPKGVLQEYWVLTDSRIPFKPVLGGVRIAALSISSDEQTLSNQVCCFSYSVGSFYF